MKVTPNHQPNPLQQNDLSPSPGNGAGPEGRAAPAPGPGGPELQNVLPHLTKQAIRRTRGAGFPDLDAEVRSLRRYYPEKAEALKRLADDLVAVAKDDAPAVAGRARDLRASITGAPDSEKSPEATGLPAGEGGSSIGPEPQTIRPEIAESMGRIIREMGIEAGALREDYGRIWARIVATRHEADDTIGYNDGKNHQKRDDD